MVPRIHYGAGYFSTPSRNNLYILKKPETNLAKGVEEERLEKFDAGKLGPWETALLMQDIFEANLLPVLPPRYSHHCIYYAEIGLLTTVKRARH